METPRTRAAAIAILAATQILLATATTPYANAAAPPRPTLETVNALAQTTAQTNGRVWALAADDNHVFAGGSFTSVRPPNAPPGTDETPRSNFAVFNTATGALLPCALDIQKPADVLDITVQALTFSPDKRTLYIGGAFRTINGVPYSRVAAIDVATCAPIPTFRPQPGGSIKTLLPSKDGSTIYLGGQFTVMNGQTRQNVAAVSTTTGALTSWAPRLDKQVRALQSSPDGKNIVIGGFFNHVNEHDSHALAVVNNTTGGTIKTFPGFIEPRSTVKVIVSDDTGFYTGNEGTGHLVFDGRIAVNWGTYTQRWRDECLGATQALAVDTATQVLYSGSHAHDCSRNRAFSEGRRRHLLAESLSAGVLQDWFPNTNGGLGEALGPRALVLTKPPGQAHTYLWAGGEFTAVNGKPQQGLTRFTDGPESAPPINPTLTITSTVKGQNRAVVRTAVDNDNAKLTYSLYRQGVPTTIWSGPVRSWPWYVPSVAYTDSDDLISGTRYCYRETVSDGYTTKWSPLACATTK